MITAEDERNFAGLERLQHQVGALGAGGGDFLEIFGVGRAFFLLLGDGNGDVAGIFDDVSDGFETGFEPSDADGRRTHVNAAAGLTEVERDANHADLARGDAAVGCASLRHTLPIHRRDAEFAEKTFFLVYSDCGACLFPTRRLGIRSLFVSNHSLELGRGSSSEGLLSSSQASNTIRAEHRELEVAFRLP